MWHWRDLSLRGAWYPFSSYNATALSTAHLDYEARKFRRLRCLFGFHFDFHLKSKNALICVGVQLLRSMYDVWGRKWAFLASCLSFAALFSLDTPGCIACLALLLSEAAFLYFRQEECWSCSCLCSCFPALGAICIQL